MKKNPLKTFIVITFISGLFITSPVYSNTVLKNSMSFESWVERLRNQAFTQGISIDTLQNTFLHNKQLDLSKSAPPVPASLQANLTHSSQSLHRQYSNNLFEISHLFGVESEVLAAIVSMENQATKNTFPAIDILINRSFRDPKNLSLQDELIEALRIIDEGQINIETFTSNSQGELGIIRFKPTIYREYAIDFDGDGVYDIWHNYIDIFASTANYLSSMGWQAGQDWGIEVALPEGFDLSLANIHQQKTLDKWHSLGILQSNGNELLPSVEFGSLIQMKDGKYYLVLKNYFALLRWKRSEEFAYTTSRLIDLIKPRPAFIDWANGDYNANQKKRYTDNSTSTVYLFDNSL